ncbi:MAG: formylglycine-generating enzyme family protein [Prosthecobacter sp.]
MKFVPVPGTNVLMCTTETTLGQYRAFGGSYIVPGFPQGLREPAVNLSWQGAKAFCASLSKKEGRQYRLPTGAEWSAAVGSTIYPWGNSWPPPSHMGNYCGQEMRACTPVERDILSLFLKDDQYVNGFPLIGDFSDAHRFTAPVGSYPANESGFYDLGGNVREWCEDIYNGKPEERLVLGASWSDAARPRSDLESADRLGLLRHLGNMTTGFRVVLVP